MRMTWAIPTEVLPYASTTISTLLISWLAGLATGQDQPRKINPIMVWTGSDSHQTTALFTRCDSHEELSAIWYNKHQANDDNDYPRLCPTVDYDKCMVIASLPGKAAATSAFSSWISSTKRTAFAFDTATSPTRPALSLAQPLPSPKHKEAQSDTSLRLRPTATHHENSYRRRRYVSSPPP